jgi:hypothetical protein
MTNEQAEAWSRDRLAEINRAIAAAQERFVKQREKIEATRARAHGWREIRDMEIDRIYRVMAREIDPLARERDQLTRALMEHAMFTLPQPVNIGSLPK